MHLDNGPSPTGAPATRTATGRAGQRPTVDRRTTLAYAAGSLATAPFSTVPGLLLLPYLTDALGVPAALAGALILVPKLWDVVLLPLAGRISDRHTGPRGPRRPFVLVGGLALGVAFAAMFADPPLGSSTSAGLYVAATFVLCATAYAFFQVPYTALGVELSDDYHERTRVMSWRVAVFGAAILISGGSSSAIVNAVGAPRGYLVMGVLMGGLMAAGAVAVYGGTARWSRAVPAGAVASGAGAAGTGASGAGTPGAGTPGAAAGGGGLRAWLALLRRWRQLRILLTVGMIQLLGIGVLLAGVSYLARYVLGRAALQSALFGAFILLALASMPVWRRLGRRRGKRSGYLAAGLVFALPLLGGAFAGSLPLWLVIAAVAMSGAGYGGLLLFPLALLPDLISGQQRAGGGQLAGVAVGLWTAAEALTFALGPAVFGLVLTAGGYVSGTTGGVPQSPGTVTAIAFGSSTLPALLVLVSLPLLRRGSFGPDAPPP
jgi:Na+/melibiose symporter-like transporter